MSNGNPAPSSGGTITSTAPGNFVNNSGLSTASTVFGGSISGAVSYYKTGSSAAGVRIFTSPLTHTGSTSVLAGVMTLRDESSLLNTSSIHIKSATLTLDNQGLATSQNRLSDSAVIHLSSGSIVVNGRQSFDAETIGTLNLAQGASNVSYFELGNTTTGAYTLNVSNLTHDASQGGVVLFNAGNNLILGGPMV